MNRKENPINPAEMIRLVGHTDMTMICRVHYRAGMQRTGEKVAAMSILDERPQLAAVAKTGG